MENKIVSPDYDEPAFDLPVENELLMLKLKAEFGAECTAGKEEIPPLVVNEFLKSVYEFEQRFREAAPRVTIYEKIGKPEFITESALNAAEIGVELHRLMQILRSRHLDLDVLGEYDDRTIYKFLTEEFFAHEVDNIDMPGYMHQFCYEEFHPNHEMDVRNRSIEMLTQWLERKVNDYSWQLAETFVHPDSRVFPREVILDRINTFFARYSGFENGHFEIRRVAVDWHDDRKIGRARVEGSISYDGRMAARHKDRFRGPFEFYLCSDGDWWDIFYFIIPGFSWNE